MIIVVKLLVGWAIAGTHAMLELARNCNSRLERVRTHHKDARTAAQDLGQPCATGSSKAQAQQLVAGIKQAG